MTACSEDDEGGTRAPVEASAPLRFVAVGDVGKGNEGQQRVAAAMKRKCDRDGCDMVLLLGDNIYESGVTSTTDPEWQAKFVEPYAALDVPFYAVLGNHDYGGLGAGNEFDKGPIQVAYSAQSSKWHMPATFYTVTLGQAGFVALDTNSLDWANVTNGDQRSWIDGALSSLGTRWKIAAGHHPYLSNGLHGNAGSYLLDAAGDGAGVKQFFDEHICGKVDVYLAGHDHDREWFDSSACAGTELIVSGAGADPRPVGQSQPVLWQEGGTLGFLYVIVDATTFTGQFIGDDDQVDFERTLSK